MSSIAAVLFDIGGVVTASPLHAIARFERDHGIAPNAINRVVVDTGDEGAWSRLERGELTVETFCVAFERDCRGFGLDVSGTRLMEYVAEARAPRPRMLEGIRRLRERGLRVGALTNNWRRDAVAADGHAVAADGHAVAADGHAVGQGHPLRSHFEIVVESSVVGLRKPDPRIYALACRELGVPPARTAFLDDIGRNLKTARALGMTTIKVDDPDEALRQLGVVVGFDLV